jgi:sodium-dependent dicarboxylate transporter 2/3/5
MKRFLLFLGPTLFIFSFLLPLERKLSFSIGLILWMGVWWVGEVLPLYVTALLPLVLAPLFGILTPQEVSVNYARPTVFLFLGGFIIARALEKYNIHLYLTQRLVRIFGRSEIGVFLGISLSVYFLSMWISNTSATAVVIPMILSLGSSGILKALAISSAYSSSIGGMATLVGTPPNMVYAGVLKRFSENITFLDWLKFGLPYSLLLEIVFILVAIFGFKLSGRKLNLSISEIRLDKRGKIVALVFLTTALLWILLPVINEKLKLNIEESTVAIASAIFLFVFKLVEWEDLRDIPWGALLLFGGGLALSDIIVKTGFSDFVVKNFQIFEGFPNLFLIGIWAVFVLALTEFASNTAVASVLVPIAYNFAKGTNLDPSALAAVVAISSSGAFMLPVATPPNMLVYSFGLVSLRELLRFGLIMNILSLTLNIIITYNFAP